MKCITIEPEGPVINFDSIKFYGAVINAWAHLFPDELDFLISEIKEGKVQFSSPLPYIDGTLYLPSPRVSFREAKKFVGEGKDAKRYEKIDHVKKLKKTAYLPAEYVQELEGDVFPSFLMERIYKEEQFPTPKAHHDVRPHVQINRFDGSSTIFYLEDEISYGASEKEGKHLKPVHLKILYRGERDRELDAALKFIEDRGISKKMSWGLGKVKLRRGTMKNEILPKIEGFHYLLSKYIPKDDEKKSIDVHGSRMDIGYLTGYRGDGKPIPQIHYIKEGSLLKSDRKLIGEVIDEGDWTLSGTGFFLGDMYEN